MSGTEIVELSAMFDAAENIVVFTGAGISTESGIPDFRGPNGIWKTIYLMWSLRFAYWRGASPEDLVSKYR